MDTITVTPTEQQDYFKFPKEWIGKMNVQITATPIEKDNEQKKFVPIKERFPNMSGSQIFEILHKQVMDSLSPEELEESNKRIAKMREIAHKYPLNVTEAKKWIAESRGYQYEEQ